MLKFVEAVGEAQLWKNDGLLWVMAGNGGCRRFVSVSVVVVVNESRSRSSGEEEGTDVKQIKYTKKERTEKFKQHKGSTVKAINWV